MARTGFGEAAMTGRARVLAVAILALVTGAPGTVAAQATPEEVSQQVTSDPGPIRFGAAQAATPGLSRVQAVQALEQIAGRPLAVVRTYDRWDSPFPDSTATALRSSGHTLFLSIKTRRANGAYVRWADIAAAKPGSALYQDMVRWADAIKAYQVPIYVTFNHEPETSVSHRSGSPTEYVAAWQAFVGLFRARGVTNARFAWVNAIRNYSRNPSSYKYAPQYFPGEAWVDVLAIDAYNTYCPRKGGGFSDPWRSLDTILGPFMTFAAQHPSLELAVAEFGSAEDPAQPQRKGDWIEAAGRLFQQPGYERFRLVSYWNQATPNKPPCDFLVTTSAAAQAAFAEMAQDPYYSVP